MTYIDHALDPLRRPAETCTCILRWYPNRCRVHSERNQNAVTHGSANRVSPSGSGELTIPQPAECGRDAGRSVEEP